MPMPMSKPAETPPQNTPTKKDVASGGGGSLNLLDRETFMELLRTVGLPGLIIVAWLIALITGQSNATNLMLWGSVLAGSVFVNFMVFQLSSWKEAIVVAMKGIVNQQSLQTIEILEIMMSSQNSIVTNLNTLIAIEEGRLTLTQIKKLIIFYLCESLKWKTWQTILAALDPAILSGVSQSSLQRTMEIHANAVLQQLATYNKVMARIEVLTIVNKAIEKIFNIVFDKNHAQNTDFSSRVHQIMDAVKIEYDTCADELNQFLGKVV